MPKKPTDSKNSSSQQLTFTIRQEPNFETDEPVEFGCFSRNWNDEESLDKLMDDLDAGCINDKQALLHAQKLLAQSPGNLELQNYLANRLWALEMRDEATEVWAKAFKKANALIPKSYSGQISWSEVDNRPFLRVAQGHLLGLMDRVMPKPLSSSPKKCWLGVRRTTWAFACWWATSA